MFALTLGVVRGTPAQGRGAGACPPGDALCILQRMREGGLITQQQYQGTQIYTHEVKILDFSSFLLSNLFSPFTF